MDWLKKNLLTVALLLLVLLLVYKEFQPVIRPLTGVGKGEMMLESVAEAPGLVAQRGIIPPMSSLPPVESEERLVVEKSSMSLVVSQVRETTNKIINYAKQSGGFMVSTSLTRPEEAPFAAVVVRVPADKFQETLDYLRELAVKVSSENILGTDVTAEYTDIGARLVTLEKTKVKFESILDQATRVEDILKVQRELISLQDRIDGLKGRQKYLEQTAKLAKITVYLSTDELALPYTPAKPFRPAVIFKLAARSLIHTLRSTVTLLIWLAVYAVIWLPIILIIFLIRRRKK